MKYSRKIQFFIFLIGLYSFVAFVPKIVCAQEFSFSTSPPYYFVTTPPGESYSLPIKITNLGDAQNIVYNIRSLMINDEKGTLMIDESVDESEFEFTLSNSEHKFGVPFLFQSNKSETVSVSVSIPSNSPKNDYYYGLVVSSVSHQTADESLEITLQQNLVVPLLFSVSKTEIDSQAMIVQFQPSHVLFNRIFSSNIYVLDSIQKPALSFVVANTGEHALSSSAKVQVSFRGVGAQKKQEYSFDERTLLPGSQKSFTENSELFLPRAFIGKYIVQGSVSVQQGEQNIHDTIEVVILPISYIGGVMLVVCIFGGVRMIRKNTPRSTSSIFLSRKK